MIDGSQDKVLILEDHASQAEQLESLLREAGFDVIGPAGTLAEGFTCLRDVAPDCAVVDLNLHGQNSFSVADALMAGDTPFVFLSAHAPEILPARFRGHPFVQKPYEIENLLHVIQDLRRPEPGADGSAATSLRIAGLRQADCQIKRARQRIECQRALVQGLCEQDANIAAALRLLTELTESLSVMEEGRQQILKDIAAS